MFAGCLTWINKPHSAEASSWIIHQKPVIMYSLIRWYALRFKHTCTYIKPQTCRHNTLMIIWLIQLCNIGCRLPDLRITSERTGWSDLKSSTLRNLLKTFPTLGICFVRIACPLDERTAINDANFDLTLYCRCWWYHNNDTTSVTHGEFSERHLLALALLLVWHVITQ